MTLSSYEHTSIERVQYIITPPKDVCIDESGAPFPDRLGIKLCKLCVKSGLDNWRLIQWCD